MNLYPSPPSIPILSSSSKGTNTLDTAPPHPPQSHPSRGCETAALSLRDNPLSHYHLMADGSFASPYSPRTSPPSSLKVPSHTTSERDCFVQGHQRGDDNAGEGAGSFRTALTLRPHPHQVTRALESAPRKTLQLYHLTVTCGPGAYCFPAPVPRSPPRPGPDKAEPSTQPEGSQATITRNSGSIGRGLRERERNWEVAEEEHVHRRKTSEAATVRTTAAAAALETAAAAGACVGT